MIVRALALCALRCLSIYILALCALRCLSIYISELLYLLNLLNPHTIVLQSFKSNKHR